jgi:lipoprotein NlpD
MDCRRYRGHRYSRAAIYLSAFLAVAALVHGCGTTVPAPVRDRTEPPLRRSALYTVQKGDTLYSIAFDAGQDYRTVAGWNGISPPFRIVPGQRIRLAAPPDYPASAPRRRYPQAPRSPPKEPQVKVSGWIWPSDGPILRRFSLGQGNKGIDIGGSTGQPVLSAAGGRVVYAGSGLRGYGMLIIVKHNETFLSAYAHNRKLRVAEGSQVSGGQHIADMGDTGTNRTKLHFEIRRDGIPVDPLHYLPKRGP